MTAPTKPTIKLRLPACVPQRVDPRDEVTGPIELNVPAARPARVAIDRDELFQALREIAEALIGARAWNESLDGARTFKSAFLEECLKQIDAAAGHLAEQVLP